MTADEFRSAFPVTSAILLFYLRCVFALTQLLHLLPDLKGCWAMVAEEMAIMLEIELQ